MPKIDLEKYNYRIYIHKVLKQVHPDQEITLTASNEINGLIHHLLDKIIDICSSLVKNRHKSVLSARDIQSAVNILLPGELAKHAISQGTKAVTKFTNSQFGSKPLIGVNGKKPKYKREALAGLAFKVSRTENIMREQMPKHLRLAVGAPIYLTSLIEYITAEILELAGNILNDQKLRRLTTRQIALAIKQDSELSALFSDVVLSGGVVPNK